jgi:hypothetical protein
VVDEGRDEAYRKEIESNRRTFAAMTAVATSCSEAGDWAEAAARAQMAAHFAFRSHAGVFASNLLEELLENAATQIPASWRYGGKRKGVEHEGRERVLHVVTSVGPTGGHTRLATRWMELDSARRHSLAITGMFSLALPAQVSEPVLRSGGTIYRVDRGLGQDLLRRAARLRALAREHDLVVLHTHPYDVLPNLAFPPGARPCPVLFLNHADHLFWLGVRAASSFACLREPGRLLCVSQRGIPREATYLLPIPLLPRSAERSRQDARRALGFREDALVCLTMASGYKFQGYGPRSLAAAIGPALNALPSLEWHVIGPESPPYRAGEQAHPRVVAHGVIPKPRDYLAAADLYLDSYPFSSLTSMLEAGQWGCVLASYAEGRTDCAIHRLGDPALDSNLLPEPASPDALAALLVDWARGGNRAIRAQGEFTAATIDAMHTGDGWRAYLEGAYAHARAAHVNGNTVAPQAAPESNEPKDWLIAAMHRVSGTSLRPEEALVAHASELPAGPRLRSWLARPNADRNLRELLPSHLRGMIGAVAAEIGLRQDASFSEGARW